MSWRVVNIVKRDAQSCAHREFRTGDVPMCKAASNPTGDCIEKHCPVIIYSNE